MDREPRADANADTDDTRAYALEVVVEPEEGAWHAWCPTLLDYGAATWGATREEALGHIREVVAMVVGRLAEAGGPIPPAAGATGRPAGSRGATSGGGGRWGWGAWPGRACRSRRRPTPPGCPTGPGGEQPRSG